MAKAEAKKPATKAAPAKAEKKLPTKKIRQRNQVLKGTHGGMQLVLIEDVTHLGKQGDLVEVKAGYGRNYLVPYGLAVVPDAHNLKRLEGYKIKVSKAREARIADLKVLAEQLARMGSFTIEANATDDDHLYGSIGAAEISKLLKGKNLGIEASMVKLDHPIKEANTISDVPLNLGYGIESKIQLIVVGIKQGAAPAKK
ncbi:50S ribosomal protein L9 [Limnoglobus roseus]|uniref:Large ribosomal subunit protein bL9 n=1 Tax=Limnoglobus roseus TaxID=2598579 RepID=A0A5C1ABU6_9BACT|nr:50S ribosomal protein L9 [Limnoglobus roseus]QEL15272.1 50S ribosomal protein L9 [Limnoglobus roseus]